MPHHVTLTSYTLVFIPFLCSAYLVYVAYINKSRLISNK